MVEIWVSLFDGEADKDLGVHRFVACPRVGESAVVWVNGEMTVVEVFSVHHSSRPVAGRAPEGDPNIVIRATRKPR
jgi:hypothetical protein